MFVEPNKMADFRTFLQNSETMPPALQKAVNRMILKLTSTGRTILSQLLDTFPRVDLLHFLNDE